MSISMTYPQLLRNEVTVDGQTHHMWPSMTAVVSALLMRRGDIVTYDELIEVVYPDPDTQPLGARASIKVAICKHRHILNNKFRCVWGWGYVIDREGDPVTVSCGCDGADENCRECRSQGLAA